VRAPRARALLVGVLCSLALAAAFADGASPCGLCVEDKVAATFDAGVLARAARSKHVVVFAELRGPAAGAPTALADFVSRTLAHTPGVDPGTVRVSLDPPAAAFACDPRRHPPESVLASASAALAARRLSLRVIKVDDGARVAGTPGPATAPVSVAR
jgi:hypothetical protein